MDGTDPARTSVGPYGVVGRSLTLPARDGYPLAGCLFTPEGVAPMGAVLLGPANAVPARFYQPLARHLASRGFAALTCDYRGIGRSAPAGGARNVGTTLRMWAQLDLGGALAWLSDALPGTPLFVVGHSLAGQTLALADEAGSLAGAYLVASQAGSHEVWSGAERAFMWAFWNVLLPGITHALGYFPGTLLGSSEDLPKGAALEWSRWGRADDYLLSAVPRARERFARLRMPIRVVSVEGDFYAPLAGVDVLAAWYAGAELSRLHVTEPYPVAAIGHFGFFREGPGAALWPDLVAFLRATAARAG